MHKKNKDDQPPGTFHQFGIADADVVGGRFGAISKSKVTGSSERAEYPEQAPDSPWSTQLPDEPPLGFAVDGTIPVGEQFEISKSVEACGGGECSEANPPAVSVETSPPPFSKRRRKR